MSFSRPTTFADAFITAAVKAGVKTDKVDHRPAAETWVARRVINNCNRGTFGIVHEPDRRPVKVKGN